MNKTTQLANIRVGYCDFKIIVNRAEEVWSRKYLLYRAEKEYRADGVHYHKTLEASYDNYAEAIETVAHLQDYYANYCRIPKVKELSR